MARDRHPDLGPEDPFIQRLTLDEARMTVDNEHGAASEAFYRSRRIKELVREWVGQTKFNGNTKGVTGLIEKAANLIDAIDDAEVPAKKVSES